jgi:hypothetical protein
VREQYQSRDPSRLGYGCCSSCPSAPTGTDNGDFINTIHFQLSHGSQDVEVGLLIVLKADRRLPSPPIVNRKYAKARSSKPPRLHFPGFSDAMPTGNQNNATAATSVIMAAH